MKLVTQKVEDWLALALASLGSENRFPIYTGEATETNRVRPSIVCICADAAVTPPFLWKDNERTCTAEVYLASPSDETLSIHTSRCAALEAALQDEATVSAFAADVPDFFLYRYEIVSTANESDAGTRSRMTSYTISVICRDDNGDGT